MLIVSGITATARFVRDLFQEAGFFVTLKGVSAKTPAEADVILSSSKANYVILHEKDVTCAKEYRVVCLHDGVLAALLKGRTLSYDGSKTVGKTPAGYKITEFMVVIEGFSV